MSHILTDAQYMLYTELNSLASKCCWEDHLRKSANFYRWFSCQYPLSIVLI